MAKVPLTPTDIGDIMVRLTKPCPCGQSAVQLNGYVSLDCPKGAGNCDVQQYLSANGLAPLETGKH